MPSMTKTELHRGPAGIATSGLAFTSLKVSGSDAMGAPARLSRPASRQGGGRGSPVYPRVANVDRLDSFVDLTTYRIPRLRYGAHDSPEDGVCAMELLAFLEGHAHSARPPCTCEVVTAYVHRFNDLMEDDRQRLIPYLGRLVGTVSKEHQADRAERALRRVLVTLVPVIVNRMGSRKCAPALAAFNAAMDLDLATAGRHLRTLSKLTASGTLKLLASAIEACCAGREFGPGAGEMWLVEAVYRLPEVLERVLKHRKYFRLEKETVVQIALEALDEMLSIGPSSGWSPGIAARLRQLEKLAEVQDQRLADSPSPTPVAVPFVPVWKAIGLKLRALVRHVCDTAGRTMRALDPTSADQAQAG
jgi:hypothetical protein